MIIYPVNDRFSTPPELKCGHCMHGHIVIKEDDLTRKYGAAAMTDYDITSDPESYTGPFVTIANCSSSSCGEHTIMAGVWYTIQNGYDNGQDETGAYIHPGAPIYKHEYKPLYLHPSPPLCDLHKEYPDNITALLKQSFITFWVDANACANTLRRVVEEIGLHLSAELKAKQNRPKISTIIAQLKADFAKIPTKSLDLLVQLGHDGSHKGGLDRQTLYNLYPHLDAVLHHCFVQPILDDSSDRLLGSRK